MSEIWEKLKEPFAPDKVSWRVGATNDNSGLALAYIDARDVMERLDAVCGPDGWQDSYTETAKGRVICTIRIRIGDEWIAKSDGAGNTDVEADKGGISDAFKRAAVKWGIGRYLYDVDSPWVKIIKRGKSTLIDPSELPRLARMLASTDGQAPPQEAPYIVESKAILLVADGFATAEQVEAYVKAVGPRLHAIKALNERAYTRLMERFGEIEASKRIAA